MPAARAWFCVPAEMAERCLETMAGSTSFWDCGEFIATAYTLGIPHPPATPLYVVLGRVFTLLPLPLSVAQKVNFMSALCGALGILVLFFIIVDIVRERRGPMRTTLDRIVVYGSGLVGALFTAWSTTYWTNSVEAEVYAISSFVMGLTTLLARQWSRKPNDPHSTGDIYLIIYLLSLGVGFHLGTVLTYPAIVLYCLLFRDKSFKGPYWVGPTSILNDPDGHAYRMFGPKGQHDLWRDAEWDRLMQDARTSLDQTRRRADYAAARVERGVRHLGISAPYAAFFGVIAAFAISWLVFR